MKVQIPNELKTDVPPSSFGKLLAATPVVMAVVATMLAGLASSEMTRAQYDRSLGAQQQSKAGDQWSFFQAKRLRGAYQRNTAELLQSITAVRPLDADALRQWAAGDQDMLAALDTPAGQQMLTLLKTGQVPRIPESSGLDPKLKPALEGLDHLVPDSEMAALLAPVSNETLGQAVAAARDQAEAFDRATQPINQSVDQIDALISKHAANSPAAFSAAAPAMNRDFTAARLRYTAARYEVEARLNQSIANLYELQVRKSNFSAERHHDRSQRFFVGMLAAQLGVIVSTFALAARQRSLLWGIAAAAGLVAIAFAIYVYLYV
jgi:hypothetical protein